MPGASVAKIGPVDPALSRVNDDLWPWRDSKPKAVNRRGLGDEADRIVDEILAHRAEDQNQGRPFSS
jgi:hypothetical protein